MTTRPSLRFLTTSLPARAALLALFACPPADAQQPNIVFIFTDDQQYNALAANGNQILQSPTMDQIAAAGVRFTQARAVLPVCSPSRAAIVSGQYNSSNGVEDLSDAFNPGSPRLGVELQNAGYATGVTGKWHIVGQLRQKKLGFDYYATFNSNGSYYRNFNNISDPNAPAKPGNQHIDSYSADRAGDFIDQSLAADKPFFLWHNTQTPHVDGSLSWNALPENLAKYDATDFYDAPGGVNNLPGNWDDDLKNKPEYLQTIRNRELAQTDPRYLYGDPNELADHTSEYYAVITELNDMLAPVMDKLNTTPDPRNPGHNLIDNTYVFFMSDNGWLMGDHGMTSKSLPYDQAARVPFMVRGPGVDVGRVDDRQVANVDLAPTILEIAGVPQANQPAAIQGKSLLGMLTDGGAGAGVRQTGIVEIWESTFAGNKPLLAGYDGRYEVFYTYDNESDELPSYVEVYDTQDDPWELANLAETIGQDAPAYRAFQAIHADIQSHRTGILGIPAHDLKTVAEGETFRLRSQPYTAKQMIPQVVAASVEAQNNSRVEGVGVVLGSFTARSGSTVEVAIRFSSTPRGTAVASLNDQSLAGIQKRSINVYRGGHLDNLVVSDEADGFLDVTTRVTADGLVVVEQLLAPGFLRVAGDYTHEAGATLELDLISAGDVDKLIVDGQLLLQGGVVRVSLGEGYDPAAGDSFDVLDFGSITGGFDRVELPELAEGLAWDDSQLLVTGEITVGMVGDYNADGVVDAADYTVWRDNLGADGAALRFRDPRQTGVVGVADYLAWRANFDQSIAELPPPGGIRPEVNRLTRSPKSGARRASHAASSPGDPGPPCRP